MTDNKGLHSQPNVELDLLGGQIEELLESIGTQHDALRLSIQESRDVDEYALQRLTARLTVQRDDLWRFDEQLQRWRDYDLSEAQSSMVNHLGEQMVRLYSLIDAALQLIGKLQWNTADRSAEQRQGTNRLIAPRKRRAKNRTRPPERP